MTRTATRLVLSLAAISLLGGRKGCSLLESGWVGGPPTIITAIKVEAPAAGRRRQSVPFAAYFGNNACHKTLKPSVMVDEYARMVDVAVGGFPDGNGGTFDAPGCGALKADLSFTPEGSGTYKFRNEASEVIAEVAISD